MLAAPTLIDLGTFRGESYGDPVVDEEAKQAVALLQGSTDAVWVFTGFEDPPADPRLARILKNAICDLALWLGAQYANRDEINSPFNSERIGSYSYSKMQAAQKSVQMGGEGSGLFWLDLLFRALSNENDADPEKAWSNSENVFNPDDLSYAQQAYLEDEREFNSPFPPIRVSGPDHDVVRGGEP